jgi:hypothetical protein
MKINLPRGGVSKSYLGLSFGSRWIKTKPKNNYSGREEDIRKGG